MIPVEFTCEYIEANSPTEEQLYTAFLDSGEPYRSLQRHERIPQVPYHSIVVH